jgi:hypothetical protein
VTGVVTHAGVTATFNPTSSLATSTTYTATVAPGPRTWRAMLLSPISYGALRQG